MSFDLPWDLSKYREDLDYRESVREEIRVTARKLLSGEIGTIEASRKLTGFNEMPEEGFLGLLAVFFNVDDASCAFPLGNVRQHWNTEALPRENLKIADVERRWHREATEAATGILRLLT
jgi:hypothetical protein